MKKAILFFLCSFNYVMHAEAQNGADTAFRIRLINFEWMPDGKNMVLGIMKFDKSMKIPPTSGVFLFNTEDRKFNLLISGATNPAISPDGKTLAYTKRQNNKPRIFLCDMSTKQERELSSDTTSKSSPQWSPDGKTIVYTKETGVGRNAILDIYIINLASGEIRQIAPAGGYKNYNPVWSPDGKWIVYYLEKGDNRDQVYLTDSKGSFQKNITNDTSTHNFYPSWYGKDKILYTWSPNRLAIINMDGTNRQVIEGIKTFFARYNPSKNRIAYVQVPENILMVYDVTTKKTEQLLDEKMMAGLL